MWKFLSAAVSEVQSQKVTCFAVEAVTQLLFSVLCSDKHWFDWFPKYLLTKKYTLYYLKAFQKPTKKIVIKRLLVVKEQQLRRQDRERK